MKIRVIVNDQPENRWKNVTVQGDEPGARSRSVHELSALLAFATERGCRSVSYPRTGFTVQACEECGEPVLGGPRCDWCLAIGRMEDHAIEGSQEDLQHRAQLCERLSLRLMELSQVIAVHADSASSDPIEIVDETQPRHSPVRGGENFSFQRRLSNDTVPTVTETIRWVDATGSTLDRIAAHLGTVRYREDVPGFNTYLGMRDTVYLAENDDALRARLRALVLPQPLPGTPAKFEDSHCPRCGESHTTVECVNAR